MEDRGLICCPPFTSPASAVSSLYVHIPFCERKCLYCDFYSIETTTLIGDFLVALHREIDMTAALGRGTTFRTLFLGGGTPSLLTPEQMERLFAHLHDRFVIAPDAEVTVETNPGTVDGGKLAAYRSLGVNRLSIGIQSFDARELEFLSRIHDRDEAIRCVHAARDAGFEDFSIDLIYALPGQTREQWKANLDQAAALDPPHISAYGLIVEDGTPLAHMVAAKQVSPAPAEREAELYEMTMAYFDARGYEHYEVSNYARPGHRSAHNFNYWTHGRYLGFGPSAHSFWHGGEKTPAASRWWNIRHLAEYTRRLDRGESPVVSREEIGERELLTERVFLGLRSDGLELGVLEADFGRSFVRTRKGMIADLVGEGLATLSDQRLRLTPRGYLLCDEVCVRLLGGPAQPGPLSRSVSD
jgi:oxygen-independent coproporphyrinogen-3 oxidase